MSPRTRAQVGRDAARARLLALDYQSSLVLRLAESENVTPLEIADMLYRAEVALHEDNSRLMPPLVARYRRYDRR